MMPDPNQNINPGMLNVFLSNQQKELVLREQEIELRKQQEDHAFEFSKQALEVKQKELANQRQNNLDILKYKYNFAVIAMVMIATFIICALYLNKEQIVLELVKIFGS